MQWDKESGLTIMPRKYIIVTTKEITFLLEFTEYLTDFSVPHKLHFGVGL